jgi:biopolymer transport protein ExbB
MHIVERAKNIMMNTGSAWVMWLLVVLSVASIAIILERIFALRSLRTDLSNVRSSLVEGLLEGGFAKARALLTGCRHPAALVALRGLARSESETTAKGAQEAMAAESVAQKRVMERRFSFLATLGANAPFIGLFGTVVGILQAFDALGHSSMAGSASAIAPQAVMSSIAEALVATAIGLGVAIPAVVAYNMFERTVKSALEDAEVLSREILSYLESRNEGAPSSAREPASQQKHGSMLRRAASMS